MAVTSPSTPETWLFLESRPFNLNTRSTLPCLLRTSVQRREHTFYVYFPLLWQHLWLPRSQTQWSVLRFTLPDLLTVPHANRSPILSALSFPWHEGLLSWFYSCLSWCLFSVFLASSFSPTKSLNVTVPRNLPLDSEVSRGSVGKVLTARKMAERLQFCSSVEDTRKQLPCRRNGVWCWSGPFHSPMEGGREAYAEGCRILWRQEIIDCLVQEKNPSFQRQLSPHHKRWSLSGASASRRYPASYLLSRNGCALPQKLPEPSWETNMLMDFWKCDLAASWKRLMLVLWYHTPRHFTRKFNRRQMAMPRGLTQLKRQRRKLKKQSIKDGRCRRRRGHFPCPFSGLLMEQLRSGWPNRWAWSL